VVLERTALGAPGRQGTTALRVRAQTVATGMRRVERAEAEYARRQKTTDSARTGFTRSQEYRRQKGLVELTIELADAVDELCAAWQLFRVLAAAEGLTWQEALGRTLPGLFSHDGTHADALRQDTTFSYVVVKSEADVMKCFRWRCDHGYC
jgi:hypothetical protein